MRVDKPKNIEDFLEWEKSDLKVQIRSSEINYIKLVLEHAKNKFEKSNFWTSFLDQLQEFNQEYYIDTEYYLFKSDYKPEIFIKPYDSIVSKTFRKNIVLNKNFPNEPFGGWYCRLNNLNRFNDLIRTNIVVKYLDGIEFIIEKLKVLAKDNGLDFRVHFEARETGYYAVHTYLKHELEVPNINWDTKKEKFIIEIQITTELQENIKKLTHKYYSSKRDQEVSKKEKWQWKYESDEFSVNYLGHILHYLEGQIMEIRNKNNK